MSFLRSVAAGVLFFLAPPGCHDEDPPEYPCCGRADTIRLFFLLDAPQPSQEELDETSELLGMELQVSDQIYGATTVFWDPGQEEGAAKGDTDAHEKAYCHFVVWAGTPQVFAHELGHAHSLGHVDQPGNLMDGSVLGTDLTEEQVDMMRYGAWWRLEFC